MKRLKKILLWVFFAACISIFLGITDCWVAGTARRDTLFSKTVWAVSDGGTRGYVGFGYSLTYYRKMEGEHGPEIWFWFTPFTIYWTSEGKGIRRLFESESKEPTYQGRNLSQWISIYFSGYSGYSPHATLEEENASEQAIRTMGTNTFPTLITWLTDEPSRINVRSTALTVFQILGEEGRPAAPALIELTKNKNEEIRMYALDSLKAIKPEKEIFTPALVTLIHDPDKNLSYEAAETLLEIDPDAADKAGVFNLFPQLK